MKLDLHGYTIHQAWKEANQFITEAYYHGNKKVTIICGHGIIKQEIEEWFALHPKVRDFVLLRNGGSYVLKIAKRHREIVKATR